jgi:hypothetical protein
MDYDASDVHGNILALPPIVSKVVLGHRIGRCVLFQRRSAAEMTVVVMGHGLSGLGVTFLGAGDGKTRERLPPAWRGRGAATLAHIQVALLLATSPEQRWQEDHIVIDVGRSYSSRRAYRPSRPSTAASTRS